MVATAGVHCRSRLTDPRWPPWESHTTLPGMKAHAAACIFPLMSDQDLRSLADDIRRHGLREPIVVHDRQILDGRCRIRACRLAGVKPRFVRWVPRGQTPLEWVLSTNLHRRHLSDDQRAMVAARIREQLRSRLVGERAKRGAASRWATGEKCLPQAYGGKHEPPKDSRVIAARMLNVSRAKVGQAVTVMESDLAPRVMSGDMGLAVAVRELDRRVMLAADKAVAKSRAKASGGVAPGAAVAHMDFETLLASRKDVPLVLSDIPYERGFLSNLERLSRAVADCLAPQGSAVFMTGQMYMPEYYSAFSAHLAYRWTMAYLLPQGLAPRVWPRKACPMWKPVLVFQRRDCPAARQWIRRDTLDAGALETKVHAHQQDVPGMRALVELFSLPGDTVVDPCMGSGTTGVASLLAGRNFVGGDVNADTVRMARARLEAETGMTVRRLRP